MKINMLNSLLDTVLPPRCVISGDEVDRQGMITPQIWASLRFIAKPYCSCCGLPFEYEVEGNALCGACLDVRPYYASARAALVYDDISKDIILRFKHADHMHAVTAFVPWLVSAGQEILGDIDLIVPVPLHRWRLLKRRYNQAAVIAKALGKEKGIPFAPEAVQRIRATATQGHKRAKERHENVKNAFSINPKGMTVIAGKKILLVDDVYTTGSTVNECAKILMEGGASEVHVLTLAKVLR